MFPASRELYQAFLHAVKNRFLEAVLMEGAVLNRSMHEVWQIVLEETDRVGKVRLQAADTYLLQISEPCKPVRTAKSHVAKKVTRLVCNCD